MNTLYKKPGHRVKTGASLRISVALFSIIANYQISDGTTDYQMSKNDAHPSKHVRLHEIFHEQKCILLSLEKNYNNG